MNFLKTLAPITLIAGSLSFSSPLPTQAQAGGVTCECRPGLRYVPGRKYSSYVNDSCAYRVCTETGRSVQPQQAQPAPALANTVPFAVSPNTSVIVSTNGGLLNVRSNANIGSRALRQVSSGSVHRLSGRQSRGWVQLSEGGWVHSQYLKLSTQAAPSVSPTNDAGTSFFENLFDNIFAD